MKPLKVYFSFFDLPICLKAGFQSDPAGFLYGISATIRSKISLFTLARLESMKWFSITCLAVALSRDICYALCNNSIDDAKPPNVLQPRPGPTSITAVPDFMGILPIASLGDNPPVGQRKPSRILQAFAIPVAVSSPSSQPRSRPQPS
jgi:hypothetical protein